MHFGLYDGVAALNHETGVLFLVGHDFSRTANAVIERLRAILGAGPVTSATGSRKHATTAATSRATMTPNSPNRRSEWKWNLSSADFCTAVQRVREYIANGDVYQVCLLYTSPSPRDAS